MPEGIWGALGAALSQGVNTYGVLNEQERIQKEQEARLRLAQAAAEREEARQAQQLRLQQEAATREIQDRKIAQLQQAISGARPGDDLTSFVSDIRANAPHLLPQLGKGGPGVAAGLPSAMGGADAPAETFSRRATPAEQAQQAQLDATNLTIQQKKADTARAQALMDALASGKIKDTPANRALLAQFTQVNPNEVWGSIEHPSRNTGGVGGGAGLSNLAQTVLANPALFEQLTPTVKSKIATELGNAGFDFNRPASNSAQARMADANAAITQANELKSQFSDDSPMGPLKGLAGKLPDFDVFQSMFGTRDVKKLTANINLVRQRIGKLFEGGVLRKEDEAKYREILPTPYDSPEIAISKMDNTIKTLDQDLSSYLEQQQIAGRRTGVNVPVRNPQSGNEVQRQQPLKIGRFDVQVDK